ncbi:type I secretion system permease/ATPase [Pelistega sp. MC2]|uniref:type I secretion system permease/ATPase n=1 Tax=Pelistega sp. MC2 TaxID=1720297 RepID=UPI0008DA19F1|nr:type I secretion system permease/ATPase [Pelistega sp. MC2]
MNSILKHLSIATHILGTPISEAALSANVNRNSQLDINYSSLQAVLQSYGFENTLSRRLLLEIPSLSTPVVVLLQNEEAAVIEKIEGLGDKRTYIVHQGGAPVQRLSHAQLEQLYIGYCWFIKPKITIDNRSELPEYTLPKAWFWKVLWRFKSYYFQVLLSSVLINILALMSSLYIMNVYDRVIPNQAYQTLWVLTIGVFLAISFEFVAKQIRAFLLDVAGKKADLIISSALFRRVMSLRMTEKPVSSGSYANNLRDFESVREFMTSAGVLGLVDLPFILLFIVVIAIVGGKLALVPLVIIPIVTIMGFAIQPFLAKYTLASMKEGSQRQGLAVEAIEGIETLKANNASSWAQSHWDSFTSTTAYYGMKVKTISSLMTNFTIAMQQLNTVGLVLLGAYLMNAEDVADRISMGAIIASVILSGRALAPLGQIAGLAIRFQQARNALIAINSIVERPIERESNRNYLSLEHVNGAIQFNNVTFRYETDRSESNPMVLQGLNLFIRPGEKVGILGRIGSGKSTLLKLASGLYQPQEGLVTLDGVDLKQLDPNFVRNEIAFLNQSPRLFLGTLRENLSLARTDGYSTDQELLMALNRFNLLPLIQRHPRGLDMVLGEDGAGLSGGQKQIIALARLTLRHPSIVLLDEPTASLDEMTEMQALNGLAQWTKDKTLIVVTHRKRVLNLVSRLIVIDRGRVILDGPRDEVLRQITDNKPQSSTNTRPIIKEGNDE